MSIGRLDVCLRVADVSASIRFYSAIGFEIAEGDPAKGWAVVVRETCRIGLFSPQFMGEDAVSLNFRDGEVDVVRDKLKSSGYGKVS